MDLDSPLVPAQGTVRVASETWSKALIGYILLVGSANAIFFVARSDITDIGTIIWIMPVVLIRAAFAVLVSAVLWFYLASLYLGASASMSSSIRTVGNALFHPAIALSVWCFIVLLEVPRIGSLINLWAFVNVVRAAKRVNSFGAGQVVVFVLWFLGIVVVIGFLLRSFS
jgi:hypothetical protein